MFRIDLNSIRLFEVQLQYGFKDNQTSNYESKNTTRIKTEFNGPVKNDGTKLQNTDDKTIDKSNNGSIDVNDESKSDDNSVSSAVNDKPNESQQQQTTPITSSESSSADGHPKLSCDMNNEMTIPTTTSTADLSPSSISNSDPKQSKINDDGQIIDEITAKVDKLAMNNNDDNSTTSTIDGDFVKVTGDGDTVVVDANAAASVIDGADDGKESLEMNSTTLRGSYFVSFHLTVYWENEIENFIIDKIILYSCNEIEDARLF